MILITIAFSLLGIAYGLAAIYSDRPSMYWIPTISLALMLVSNVLFIAGLHAIGSERKSHEQELAQAKVSAYIEGSKHHEDMVETWILDGMLVRLNDREYICKKY